MMKAPMLMVLDLWKGAGDRWKGNHRERQVEVLRQLGPTM